MHEFDPVTGHCLKCGLPMGAGRDALPCGDPPPGPVPTEPAPEPDE